MSKVEMKQLVITAKEMNSVMALDPKIKIIGISKEDLEEAIQLNAEEIRWEAGVDEDGDPYEADNFSEDSLLVLDSLGVGNPESKKKANKKKVTKEDEIDDAENEEVVVKTRAEKSVAKATKKAPEPEPEEDEDLPTRLASAKKMDDLNEIIVDFPDVFTKKVVKGFAELKNPILLKKAMKEAAGIAPAEKVEKPKGPKKEAGPGIIKTIISLIEKAGKKGISKETILAELIEAFPDREEKSMKNTINVQVPARISKEKFELGKTEDGKYFKK